MKLTLDKLKEMIKEIREERYDVLLAKPSSTTRSDDNSKTLSKEKENKQS